MYNSPLAYDAPLFRPPSEARSLILQVTLGCSWNRCGFCEMYRSKSFSIRGEADVLEDIKGAAESYPDIRRIFLADGDAFVLSADRLLKILGAIHEHFPNIQRVSSYALPRNIRKKTDDELKALYEAGLKLIYVGIESGDDEVLKRIGKGETAATTIDGLKRAKAAGIKSSVIIVNGLGGAKFSEQHAIGSAKVLNETEPEYFSTLVLSFPKGEERFRSIFGDDFVPLDQSGLFEEMKTLISHTNLKSTVFRSDHASNYLVLKGTLGRDKEKILYQIRSAIDSPEMAGLREEWERGL